MRCEIHSHRVIYLSIAAILVWKNGKGMVSSKWRGRKLILKV
eukprot:UN08349